MTESAPPRPSSVERLRHSALALFAERGFQGTGIRDLAEGAGLSVATLYHHMASKEDLLFSLMAESLQRLVEDADHTLAQADDPLDRLAGLTLMHVYAHALRRDRTLVVDTEIRSLGTEHRRQAIALRDEYEQRWSDALAAAEAGGLASMGSSSIARLAILEMCTGVAYWYSEQGPASLQEVALEHVNLMLAMIRAHRADGRPVTAADCNLPTAAWFHELSTRTKPPHEPQR